MTYTLYRYRLDKKPLNSAFVFYLEDTALRINIDLEDVADVLLCKTQEEITMNHERDYDCGTGLR